MVSTNIYCGGIYELEPDEALIVEVRQPVEPNYIGFASPVGRSRDFAPTFLASLNGVQAHRDADNAIRYVIAHRDPGVHNWVDTDRPWRRLHACAGRTPDKPKENLPSATVRKVRWAN